MVMMSCTFSLLPLESFLKAMRGSTSRAGSICTARCKFDAIHLKKVRDWHAGKFETMPVAAVGDIIKKSGNIIKRKVSK